MKLGYSNISKLIIGLLPCFIGLQAVAQATCSQDSLLNVKGSWNHEADWFGLAVNYPAADVRAIHQLLKKPD